ncbi:hypothetical protein [Frankia sp. R82]|uniref:hypothetical protein n=1 Tax=Frankia sp. R82 TaxID=2950553 RepID=UPI002044B906|nr:hypothetical protein [Frankia sp. R82]MCM3883139.1 hypothetical protein [Frankia sp. R82]
MPDILGDRGRALAIVQRHGFGHFLMLLNRLASIHHGVDCQIYSFGLEWMDDEPFVLKAQGVRGDLLIVWR